jgi:hypothetical protein
LENDDAKSFLLITSYTHDESEDDYDTMFEVFSDLQLRSQKRKQLHWHWDCEVNPQGATTDLERRGAPGANIYRENQCWQCISIEDKEDDEG